ncbi:CGNR zinc finger domain-containing protein [Micromonospora echinaurantiaca]|nr:CGNR zinc finger domain-containing protein [Micromonospora echinaurantiaca]
MTELNPQAPGRLELVRRFVNTLDVEAGTDRLASTDGLLKWLREVDLLQAEQSVSDAQLRRVIAVREALRDLLRANHTDTPAPESAVQVLDQAARKLSILFTRSGGWTIGSAGTGVDFLVGELVTIVIGAMNDGTWRRLKACANDTCEWAFYDRSRARSGKWCSMGSCGNRAKQQTWRHKHAHAGRYAPSAVVSDGTSTDVR